MSKIGVDLSHQLFEINTQQDVDQWLTEAKKDLGGASWRPLGGLENNVHTVQVASDPALALIERPTNSIDALLDLKHLELRETAASPHLAAQAWYGMPKGGLAEASAKQLTRAGVADLIRITMHESGDGSRPTISIQDQGTGQHPDDFPKTLLSLHESNKKGATHLMGVYGAGGAASYRFARSTILASRRSPSLLDGRSDEIGITVVRYNPLDPEKFKTGRYEYLTTRDGLVPRLELDELPQLPYGTYVKLIEYQIQKYAGPAYAPQRSLYQLVHAALPDPALPLRIIETRAQRFSGVKGDQERRQIAGLLYLLSREGVCAYREVRKVPVEPGMGFITLRYFVLAGKENPYTTSEQGLTITLNGQRQIIKDRAWLKRHLELFFLFRRLIVVVDGTQLSSEAKREMFASTRETGVDTPVTRRVLDLVLQEIQEDEDLYALEEAAKQEALAGATEATTIRVKKQLASEIGAFLKGVQGGHTGGGRKRKSGTSGRPTVRNTDDSAMLDVPDKLAILNDPIRIEQGQTGALRLEINGKNDFLPRYEDSLAVVIGQELKDHVTVRSKGRLLGGRVRVTLEAGEAAPLATSTANVVLVVPALGLVLTDQRPIEVVKARAGEEDHRTGGDLDIKVHWVGRDAWNDLGDDWDEKTVGMCEVHRRDPNQPTVITSAEWTLNEDFEPLRLVSSKQKLTAAALEAFRDAYTYPVALGLFHQRLSLDGCAAKAVEDGGGAEIPSEYQKSEQLRLASAVLLALQPEIHLAEALDE